MAITQDMVDALKQKYKTIEDVQSSDTYKKAGTDIQNQILSYYQPTQGTQQQIVQQPTQQQTAQPQIQPTQQQTVQEPVKQETKFGKEATKGRTEEQFIQRDKMIADQVNAQLQQLAKTQLIGEDTKNKAIQQVIASMGGKVDMNDSNWINTFNRISGQLGGEDYYQTLNKATVSGYTKEKIYDGMKNGTLTPEQQEAIRLTNPQLWSEYQMYDKQKQQLAVINNIMGYDVTDALKAPEKIDLSAEYKESYDTPEIKTAQENFTTAKADVDDLQAKIQDVLRQTEKKYEGTGATRAFIQAQAQKEINLLSDQYNDKYRELQLAQDRLNTLQTNADRKYQVATQQAQLDQQYRQQVLQDISAGLSLYESQFGNFGQRVALEQIGGATGKAPETQNFGTTKAPNWKQWNSETQSWESINGIEGGAAGGTGGGGTLGGQLSQLANEFIVRYNRIKKAIQSAPEFLPLSTVLALPENAADLEFVKNNLALLSFREAKAAGVTFGSTTESEWNMLKTSQISLPLLGSKKYALAELDRLAGKQGGTLQDYTPSISGYTPTINAIVSKRGGQTPFTATKTEDKSFFQKVWGVISDLR